MEQFMWTLISNGQMDTWVKHRISSFEKKPQQPEISCGPEHDVLSDIQIQAMLNGPKKINGDRDTLGRQSILDLLYNYSPEAEFPTLPI